MWLCVIASRPEYVCLTFQVELAMNDSKCLHEQWYAIKFYVWQGKCRIISAWNVSIWLFPRHMQSSIVYHFLCECSLSWTNHRIWPTVQEHVRSVCVRLLTLSTLPHQCSIVRCGSFVFKCIPGLRHQVTKKYFRWKNAWQKFCNILTNKILKMEAFTKKKVIRTCWVKNNILRSKNLYQR